MGRTSGSPDSGEETRLRRRDRSGLLRHPPPRRKRALLARPRPINGECVRMPSFLRSDRIAEPPNPTQRARGRTVNCERVSRAQAVPPRGAALPLCERAIWRHRLSSQRIRTVTQRAHLIPRPAADPPPRRCPVIPGRDGEPHLLQGQVSGARIGSPHTEVRALASDSVLRARRLRSSTDAAQAGTC
jgi:hypothetical protein